MQMYEINHLNSFIKPKNARYLARFRSGFGWAVFDPEGRCITGWGLSRKEARDIAHCKQQLEDIRLGKTTRPCMCCGKIFPSEGKHNRLCAYCKAAA